jgi:uncharacterized membrane protein YsdA (DUF1294 family)
MVPIYYIIAVNLCAFVLFGVDKWKAKKGWRRIPEAFLLMTAVLGGSVGAWIGMKVWHHKTLHKKFRYGLPAMILVQMVLIFFYIV